MGLGLLNAYSGSKLAKKHNIPFVYYLIDVVYALIPEKAFHEWSEISSESHPKSASL